MQDIHQSTTIDVTQRLGLVASRMTDATGMSTTRAWVSFLVLGLLRVALVRAILSDDTDRTVISLIDCNHTFDDIMLRDELAKYAEDYAGRFKVWHVLTVPPEDEPDFEVKCPPHASAVRRN
ncbi:hypothetical protein NUW54_g3208 [Trametes sanguinea]|uniref:Uncharacterized protein n=1 Tax=Trametes sanguinea TaxID=158606 RepID=A0ACC1Q1D8_9APHY|nr:hypothetical protein NUW54_g3208 [Trametes sanguinea]